MLEIFAVPFMGVTAVVGWFIFQPFFQVEPSESLSRSKVTIGDLLALALPTGLMCLLTGWLFPAYIQQTAVQAGALLLVMTFTAGSLAAGLFFVPKKVPVTFLQRMTVMGVIVPIGIWVTAGWSVFVLWACYHSVLYLAPGLVVVAAATLGLRTLSCWVCGASLFQLSGSSWH